MNGFSKKSIESIGCLWCAMDRDEARASSRSRSASAGVLAIATLVLSGIVSMDALGSTIVEGGTTQASPREAKSPAPAGIADGQTVKKPPVPGDGPKSLDDLLGTSKEGASGSTEAATTAAEREQNRRLETALTGASMQDLVSRAIDGMKSAADRLGESKDAGIATQRTQDEVVRMLDRLLEEAKKQERKQKGSKSSSSKSGRERKPVDDPSEQNGQEASQRREQSERSASSDQSNSSSESSSDSARPDEAGTSGDISESRVEWGKLPERIRELVLQGRRDRVSSMYERLTREYYRRLAEEASK